MNNHLTIAQIQENPHLVAASFDLPSGVSVVFRPLLPNDSKALGEYFVGLSDATRQYFGPHAFDSSTAEHLCATINMTHTIRMVATESSARNPILAYFILMLGLTDAEHYRYLQANISLNAQNDCTVAPSIADAFQNQKLGTPLMAHTIQLARVLGRGRMVLLGGTQVANQRAVHFYQKHGFRIIHSFEHPQGRQNYDMLLEL